MRVMHIEQGFSDPLLGFSLFAKGTPRDQTFAGLPVFHSLANN